MADKIELEIMCSCCRRKKFEIPANPKPNDMVTCARCGASARYKDIQASAVKQAEKAVEKSLRDALKKAGFK